MALVENSLTVHQVPAEGGIFTKSLYDDVGTVVELVAGVAEKFNYITRIRITGNTTMVVTLGSGSTGNMDTIHFGPINFTAGSKEWEMVFNGSSGMRCDLGKALVLLISVGTAAVYVEGKTSVQ